MDNLRLILIVIGLVILALIVVFHRAPGSRKTHARRRAGQRVEPGLGEEADERIEPAGEGRTEAPSQPALGGLDPEPRRAGGRVEPEIEPEIEAPGRSPASNATAAETSRKVPAGGDKIVSLYLRARHDRQITGLALLDAALKAGLSFGEMNIFHRRQEGEDRPVFSMANLTAPGSFDPHAWNLFETPGVALFMTLPGPVSALDAWDAMLATGRRLSELLEADLLDADHEPLNRERIARTREEMRDYDRRSGSL